jgi:phosphate transport system substrate-binding protein
MNFRTSLLGASALAVAAAGSVIPMPSAVALAADRSIYGAGSSLIAPYLRQYGDCFSTKTTLKFKGNPPSEQTLDDFFYAGTPSFDCATTDIAPGYLIDYISTGSGTGISAFFSHDPAKMGDTQAVAGTQLFPMVNYAMSDNSLGSAEVNIYNNGGTNSTVGVVVTAPGVTPGPGEYPNPKFKYGAMIQFPMLIAPVTVAYDPVYKKVRNGDGSITEYSLNVQQPRADGSGGLKLSQKTLCQIFNGLITNWNDSRMTAQNGQSLKDPSDPDPFDVPMQLVGRQDGSGTTSIFTRFLAAACPTSGAGSNAYLNSSLRLPGTYTDQDGVSRTTASGAGDLAGVLYNKANANDPVAGEALGTYTLADGNDGVAKYLDFTRVPGVTAGDSVVQGRIGYVGPDYTLPAVLNTSANTYDLNTADVKNAAGAYRSPRPNYVKAAFTILPPDSNADGTYDPSSTDPRDRANPQDWVEPADKSSPLANPTAPQAYPIVGTTNILTYTCGITNDVNDAKTGALYNYEVVKLVNDGNLGVLTKAGFFPLPPAWRTAIKETFLKNINPAATALNLLMAKKGSTSYCPGSTGG